MPSDKDSIETLCRLGLTLLESRVYLILCKHENLSTKVISRLTKIPQPDTYRVLAKLQEKGLIEKQIKRPAIFKIVPCDKGLSFLLERKHSDYVNLKAKTELLLHSLKEDNRGRRLENISSGFVMIPRKRAFIMRINEAIERARRSLDIISSSERVLSGLTNAFAESSEKAWARSVKFRILVEDPAKKVTAEELIQFDKRSSCCSIRFFPGPPKTVIGLFDRKEVFIIVNPKERLLDSPALWSNNQSLISALNDYFEVFWCKAMEECKATG